MKKKLFLLLVLVIAVLLTGCGSKDKTDAQQPTVQEAPAIVQPPAMEVPNNPSSEQQDLPDGYDPSKEEDEGSLLANQEAETGRNISAGATAIPIDPVDLPTATPRPPLAFTYASYTASALGLTFESVAGYDVDETHAGSIILREPADLQKDNYSVEITLSVTAVTNQYSIESLKKDLRQQLKKDLHTTNFKVWKPSEITRRTLLKKQGFYGTYRGEMYDGTVVRGRVHMALLDNNRLLTLHITYPAWYNTDYTTVYTKIRETLKMQ